MDGVIGSAPKWLGGIFSGLRIVESPNAETLKVWHTVERHPRPKRRRQWRVMRHERRDPCAYKLYDGTLVVHPALMDRMRDAMKK